MDAISQTFLWENKPLRATMADGRAWFVLADLCGLLGCVSPEKPQDFWPMPTRRGWSKPRCAR